MREPLTLARPPALQAALPRLFGAGAVLILAGVFLVAAAFRQDASRSGAELETYSLAALFIGSLFWWEATASPSAGTGVLPKWASPPALIAGWTLFWICVPATAAFFDDRLIDDFTAAQGGPAVLVTGIVLACVALTVLSLSYHSTRRALGRRSATHMPHERHVLLQRVIGLYLVSVAARTLRVLTLGIAFGADLSAWGRLQAADQWIGYIEDLRYLALALVTAHVIRRGTGRLWLGAALGCEVLFGAASGFIKPFIWPVVVCVVTAAALDRLKGRHIVLALPAVVLAASSVPVVGIVRGDRTGAIGTSYSSGLGSVAAAMTEWQGVGAGLDRAYGKFFGRQTEVAGSMGLVVTLSPAVVPFEGLQQFAALPTNLIPRAIWPEKPMLSRGQWFSVNFRGLDEDTISSSAMTIFGEGYLFYGWTGVMLAMLIAGAVLALLHRGLDNPTLVLVYLALVPTILEIEPELSSYLTSLVQRTLVFMTVFILLTHRREPVARFVCSES